MGWTYLTPEPHRHNHPKQLEQLSGVRKPQVGDRWECTCHNIYEVSSVREYGDQRDGYWWSLTWNIYSYNGGGPVNG